MSPPGRPKGEYRSAQHEGSMFGPPGRSQGEHRRAQHEGCRVIWRAIAALLLWLALPAGASAFEGVVTRVSDGDTVWVRPEGGRRKPVKVRLLGIDAPERCQPWGEQATAALTQRALHQRVVVVTRARDDHGRWLGGLSLADGTDLAAWMVVNGHAWSARYRGDPGPYAEQERQARAARRGLHGDPQALQPRQFRQQHGPCEQRAAAP